MIFWTWAWNRPLGGPRTGSFFEKRGVRHIYIYTQPSSQMRQLKPSGPEEALRCVFCNLVAIVQRNLQQTLRIILCDCKRRGKCHKYDVLGHHAQPRFKTVQEGVVSSLAPIFRLQQVTSPLEICPPTENS